jgi:hypothetical protein
MCHLTVLLFPHAVERRQQAQISSDRMPHNLQDVWIRSHCPYYLLRSVGFRREELSFQVFAGTIRRYVTEYRRLLVDLQYLYDAGIFTMKR